MRKLILILLALAMLSAGIFGFFPSIAGASHPHNFGINGFPTQDYNQVGANLYCAGGTHEVQLMSYVYDDGSNGTSTKTYDLKININGVQQYHDANFTADPTFAVGFGEGVQTNVVTSGYIIFTWPDGSNFKRNFAGFSC